MLLGLGRPGLTTFVVTAGGIEPMTLAVFVEFKEREEVDEEEVFCCCFNLVVPLGQPIVSKLVTATIAGLVVEGVAGKCSTDVVIFFC